MQPPTIDVLTARLDRLERENRRMKRCGLAVATVAGACLLMGQAAAPKNPVSSPVLTAQRLVITDEDGIERIVLGASKDRASIMLKSDPAKATTVFAVAQESAGLSVTDENGKHRLTLGKDLRVNGGAGLWLYDEQGILRYTAGVDRRGPSIAVFDENGKRLP